MTTYNEWTCIEVAKTMQGRYKKIDAAKSTRPSLRLGINHYREKKITSREAGRCGAGKEGWPTNPVFARIGHLQLTRLNAIVYCGVHKTDITHHFQQRPPPAGRGLCGAGQGGDGRIYIFHHSPQYVNSNWPVSIPSILARSTGHRSPRARSRDAQLRQARL